MAWTTALNLGMIRLPNGCPVSSSSLSFHPCPHSANRVKGGGMWPCWSSLVLPWKAVDHSASFRFASTLLLA